MVLAGLSAPHRGPDSRHSAIHPSGRAAADVTGQKLARANKVARRRLRSAQKFLDEKSYDKFYDELLKALWGYLGDKLSLPASRLSRDSIASVLGERGVSQELIDNLITVIDECEMARYTPQLSPDRASTVFNQASSAINGMEAIKLNSRS